MCSSDLEMITKINKTESWFFEKINKIDKLLARLIKRKGQRIQMNKIRNEKELTMDTTEIQSIIKDYYKHYMLIKLAAWKKWTNS